MAFNHLFATKMEESSMERKPCFRTLSEETSEELQNERHVLCPRYDWCLNEAVARNQSFCCADCAFKKQNVRVYLTHDGMAA